MQYLDELGTGKGTESDLAGHLKVEPIADQILDLASLQYPPSQSSLFEK